MLISVGTGPSVEHGIARSIRTHNPDRVIYFVTDQSRSTCSLIENLLGHPGLRSEQALVPDADDPDSIYRVACTILEKIKQQGIDPGESVVADFTSGTKAMTAGLFAAALAGGVHQLIYITGERGSDGRVISGTERIITFLPSDILADRLIAHIIELFNARLFSAARQLAGQALQEIRLPGKQQQLTDLQQLCRAYEAWDHFDHVAADAHFAHIDREIIQRWSPRIASNKGWVHRIARALQQDRPPAERYSQELIVDLWLNAERRMDEGHWIDAVARLYRLVEMIGQAALARHGLDPARLKLDDLPEALRPQYARLADETGTLKIPLRETYQLLDQLGNAVGRQYNSALEDALRARNESIGAHGLRTVTHESCQKLAGCVRSLLETFIPGYHDLASDGQFPQLGG